MWPAKSLENEIGTYQLTRDDVYYTPPLRSVWMLESTVATFFIFSIKFAFADMDSIKIVFLAILTKNKITTKSSFFKLMPIVHIVFL